MNWMRVRTSWVVDCKNSKADSTTNKDRCNFDWNNFVLAPGIRGLATVVVESLLTDQMTNLVIVERKNGSVQRTETDLEIPPAQMAD
jgi:hypothetical protein